MKLSSLVEPGEGSNAFLKEITDAMKQKQNRENVHQHEFCGFYSALLLLSRRCQVLPSCKPAGGRLESRGK